MLAMKGSYDEPEFIRSVLATCPDVRLVPQAEGGPRFALRR